MTWSGQIFIVFLLLGEIVSQNITCEVAAEKCTDKVRRSYDGNKQRVSHMDLLINNMLHQQWGPDDSVCLEKILNVMNNVKNSTLWATWIWDAMQSPVGLFYGSKFQFGNYDQCMDAPWLHTHPEYRTQYCLADIKLADEDLVHTYIHPDSHVKNYINSISTYGVTFNKLSLGVCLPAECKTRAVSQFVKVLFEDSHLGNAVHDVNITVNPCQVAGAPVEYSKEFYFVVILLVLFGSVAVLCTFFNNGQKNTTGSKLLNAFCVIKNTQKLSKSSENDIKVLHGMRYLSSVIIVTLHVVFLSMHIGFSNALKLNKDIDEFLKDFLRLDLAVDTFLMMSGLLLIKGLMASKTVNPFILIAKRYMRLACMMSIVVIILMYAAKYVRSGPFWPIYLKIDISACEMNWWTTFLMLGNYIDATNACYPVLWTMPVDFHLSVMGIILYYIFTKNRRAGILTFGFLFIASLVMPGYVTYQRKLPGVHYSDLMTTVNYRKYVLSSVTYIWTHLRGGPYFIGMITGYLLSVYKPNNHRGTIPKFVSMIGLVIALTTAVMISVISATYYDRNKPYNAWEAAIFASVNRNVWAVAMATIVLLCEYGTVPLVSSLLSWQPWVPLSKLSYGVYLLHCAIFICIVYATRVTLTYDIYSIDPVVKAYTSPTKELLILLNRVIGVTSLCLFLVLMSCMSRFRIIHILGVTMICNIAAYILHIFWEAPILGIFDILIDYITDKPEKLQKNGISKKIE